MKFCPLQSGGLITGVDLLHLGLSEVAFIEGCPHIRGGLYEGFHCMRPVFETFAIKGFQFRKICQSFSQLVLQERYSLQLADVLAFQCTLTCSS